MIVVSDTSPITALLQIGRCEILRLVYREVIIPKAVERELRLAHVQLPEFLQVVEVSNSPRVRQLTSEVDAGEAEAIVLAIERQADILLMDERRGRRIAQREGIAVIGLLGVLVEAKRFGFLSTLRDVVHELETIAGFRIAADLKNRILTEAGEA